MSKNVKKQEKRILKTSENVKKYQEIFTNSKFLKRFKNISKTFK